MSTEAGEIYASLAAIQDELQAVGKERQTSDVGNYMYRAAEDLVNALHPLFKKHKVLILDEVVSIEREQHSSQRGNAKFLTLMQMRFTFISGKDGSSVSAVSPGEAMDNADKGTGKAATYCLKTALSHLFTVPTEDWADIEQEDHEIQAGARNVPGVYKRASDAIRNVTDHQTVSALRKRIKACVEDGSLVPAEAQELEDMLSDKEKQIPVPTGDAGRNRANG